MHGRLTARTMTICTERKIAFSGNPTLLLARLEQTLPNNSLILLKKRGGQKSYRL
jgi:hypothetical protein